VSTKQRKAARAGEEDTALSVMAMQAFADAGNKYAKRIEAQQKAMGEDEGSAQGHAESQEIPFDEEIQGVEDDTTASLPTSTPVNPTPASI